QMLIQSIRIMAFIAIPVTFYSLCMDRSLIALLFQTGRFDENSIEMTVQVFRCHIVGLYFIALNRIVAPAFYAQQDTLSPTIAGLINFAVNMLLAIILSKFMGGPGIALALTIASGANMLMLFIFLRKNQNVAVRSIIGNTTLYTFRMIVFSFIASVPVLLLKNNILRIFGGHGRLISQGFPIAITAILFGTVGVSLMIVTRDPLVKNISEKIMRKIGRKTK
ncbi:MAG: lipid II flippase MurJ, partial [Treponema sp.]|nr:lipid II flippase MurJ [Treponema sp.]